MGWNVELTNKAKKQADKLPKAVQDSLKLLMREIARGRPCSWQLGELFQALR